MKKIFSGSLLLIISLLLLGCQNQEALTIIVPAGSPALAQLYIQNQPENYDVDVVNGADPLVVAFNETTRSYDIIFAPTNLGAKLYQNLPNYQFAGTISWGNYYLITKGMDLFTMSELSGKDIVVFGQNQTSDIIIQYLTNELNLSVTMTYVYSVATAASMFIANTDLIVMVAEPSLSVIESKVTGIQTIDLQTVYESLTGLDSYPQAGVFVSTELSRRQINRFLDDLDESIQNVNDDPVAAGELAETLELGFTKAVVTAAIPRSHLAFTSAMDSKAALEAYFNLILNQNSALIGGSLPSEDFYYQP